MKKIIPYLIVLAALFSCEAEEACTTTATNAVLLGFSKIDTANNVVNDTVNFDRIYAVGASKDFFTRSEPGEVKFFVNVNAKQDTTYLIFESAGVQDQLVLTYKRRYRLISPDCGLEVKIEDLKVVDNTFDSVAVLNTELSEIRQNVDIRIFK